MLETPPRLLFFGAALYLLLTLGSPQARGGEGWDQIATFGSTGSALEQFLFPYDLVVRNDLLYVADSNNNRVQVFDLEGQFQFAFGETGVGDGQFRRDRGIGASWADGASATLFISDAKNDRVQEFTAAGVHLRSWGAIGDGPTEFFRPRGLTGAPDSSIVIGDADNDRVKVYRPDLSIRAIFGGRGSANGKFWSPHDLEVSTDGTIYVVDTFNHRVQCFSLDGQFLGKFGEYGAGDGEFVHPKAITIDAEGNLFVADTGDSQFDVERIQKFSPTGEWLTTFGSPGSGQGQLRFVTGLDFDTMGRLFVADAYNDRITVWATRTVAVPPPSLSSFKARFGG
jgi:DNA-binding beta-propeller fold protein YncE